METSFYTEEELAALGFQFLGHDVKISRKCSIYGAELSSIGDHSRIDDFCILSGPIEIGRYVHIAAGCYLFSGRYPITLKDYSCISSQTTVYAKTDDYSGEYMTNATIPDDYKNVIEKPVIIGKYVVVGTGSTILPGVKIEEGCAVGAKSLVTKSLTSWGIYMGIPATRYKERSKGMLVKSKDFINEKEES